MHWLAQLFSRRRRYDDLAISIQEHIAERADELMDRACRRPRQSRWRGGNSAMYA